jgi:hypothetical protein
VWACGCGGRARGCERMGCMSLRVQSPLRTHLCVYVRACGCVFRACVVSFPWLRPVRPPRLPIVARPRARAVRGRDISSTKLKALPEWLGQCKLLEEL